jgi:hypothetical protein
MRGVRAGLAVAGVVDDQHTLLVRGGRRVGQQQRQPALVDLLMVPGRLGQEELQALHGCVLGTGDRLGASQRGQGLVALARQQQALQIGAEAAALGQGAKQGVELGGVVLQQARCGRAGQSFGHRDHLDGDVARQPRVPRKPA